MSDGPFKNSKLCKGWKKFAEAVQDDAVSAVECRDLASDALIREILSGDVPSLMDDLLGYASQAQLDLDPFYSVESIFNGHINEPFVDILQKETMFRLSEPIKPIEVVGQALEASLNNYIGEVRTRIEEECIRALESGDMRKDQFSQTVAKADEIFSSLAKDEICKALLARDKKAFKGAVSKKDGIDEGPLL